MEDEFHLPNREYLLVTAVTRDEQFTAQILVKIYPIPQAVQGRPAIDIWRVSLRQLTLAVCSYFHVINLLILICKDTAFPAEKQEIMSQKVIDNHIRPLKFTRKF